MDKKGIGPWISFGLIFFSSNDQRYNLFKRFLYISTVIISLLVIYNLIDYGVGLYWGQALAKYRVYAVNLLWITPYVFLSLKNNSKLIWFRINAISIGLILALVTQTRSFIIIYALILFFDFYYIKKKYFIP